MKGFTKRLINGIYTALTEALEADFGFDAQDVHNMRNHYRSNLSKFRELCSFIDNNPKSTIYTVSYVNQDSLNARLLVQGDEIVVLNPHAKSKGLKMIDAFNVDKVDVQIDKCPSERNLWTHLEKMIQMLRDSGLNKNLLDKFETLHTLGEDEFLTLISNRREFVGFCINNKVMKMTSDEDVDYDCMLRMLKDSKIKSVKIPEEAFQTKSGFYCWNVKYEYSVTLDRPYDLYTEDLGDYSKFYFILNKSHVVMYDDY